MEAWLRVRGNSSGGQSQQARARFVAATVQHLQYGGAGRRRVLCSIDVRWTCLIGSTPQHHLLYTAEGRRTGRDQGRREWRRWGPYLSERQWGTVREDYSADGNAWDYFPHDHARSRAYRWGEDGIAGFSDDRLHWCLALALWNGRDPILKERLFGLTNGEGNHGEDVKELYYYLDGTPTHSYMRMLYKYPQAAFPYDAAGRGESPTRDVGPPEFELHRHRRVRRRPLLRRRRSNMPRRRPTTSLMRITRRTTAARRRRTLHVLPQLWARNTWSLADRVRAAARC